MTGPLFTDVVDELRADPDVSLAKWFGLPATKVGGKVFAALWQDERLVVKLGRARVSELAASGRAVSFDPSGKGQGFKDWADVYDPDADWLALAEEAKGFTRA